MVFFWSLRPHQSNTTAVDISVIKHGSHQLTSIIRARLFKSEINLSRSNILRSPLVLCYSLYWNVLYKRSLELDVQKLQQADWRNKPRPLTLFLKATQQSSTRDKKQGKCIRNSEFSEVLWIVNEMRSN